MKRNEIALSVLYSEENSTPIGSIRHESAISFVFDIAGVYCFNILTGDIKRKTT